MLSYHCRPNSFVYFPFGLGHRACIGKHFAMVSLHIYALAHSRTYHYYYQMEAKMAFARLFQTYEIELPENYELVVALRATVQPKDDIPCKLQCRQ